MKYADLAAIEHVDRQAMTEVVGGGSWGDVVRGSTSFINAVGQGLPHWPFIARQIGINNLRSLGDLIQLRSDQFGYPGINSPKSVIGTVTDVKFPSGLE
jgi:hypothetical protein